MELKTPRLIIRPWQQADLDGFAELNADPEVMRYFPACLTREQSDALAERCQGFIAAQGWGFWALQERQSGRFVGFTGLHYQPVKFSFSPCTEIGWRLRRRFWGLGYVSEAARACIAFAFEDLGLAEVVAFTAEQNSRSEAVMQRLGMRFRGRFEHPDFQSNSPLSRHLLYALESSEFLG